MILEKQVEIQNRVGKLLDEANIVLEMVENDPNFDPDCYEHDYIAGYLEDLIRNAVRVLQYLVD